MVFQLLHKLVSHIVCAAVQVKTIELEPTLSEDPREGGVETWGVGNRATKKYSMLHRNQAGKSHPYEKKLKKLGSANVVSTTQKSMDMVSTNSLTKTFHFRKLRRTRKSL